jgi:hypothetical protein
MDISVPLIISGSPPVLSRLVASADCARFGSSHANNGALSGQTFHAKTNLGHHYSVVGIDPAARILSSAREQRRDCLARDARIRMDAWTNQIVFMKTANVPLISAGEKLPPGDRSIPRISNALPTNRQRTKSICFSRCHPGRSATLLRHAAEGSCNP